ncbi:NAD(P)-binding protein [Lentinus tigrinus ALCF2SS1-6]|uniref:Probable quinone oxidoreductase n=1 Tax=Lentinus tigrinus ALCF2SS1-6 TaxID=1328759 RepID=A0A5C2SQI4_9APHY|nr:NAD(P)-binding protein [Lentinus tigrinus ALCF2SS1-6]
MSLDSLPSTMRAIGINKYGDLDAIEQLELPTPKPKPSELLVKVEYGGVNWIDSAFRSGIIPAVFLSAPPPKALGAEAAGTIVALPTDEGVLSSEDYKARGFHVGGRVAVWCQGAFSEYIVAPWTNAALIPNDISTRDAAAAMMQGMGFTAVTLISEAYNVQQGDHVLVHTVAGGMGLCLAQLIAARGATVIGTTSTPEKAEIAKAHGATHVILYKQEDVAKRVLELTDGKGVDAIFDAVGKDTFESDLKMIKKRGTIVGFGSMSGPIPPFDLRRFMEKNVKFTYTTAMIYGEDPKEALKWYNEVWRLVANGTLKMRINEYPFTAEGVKASQEDMTSRKSVGKLLIKVA